MNALAEGFQRFGFGEGPESEWSITFDEALYIVDPQSRQILRREGSGYKILLRKGWNITAFAPEGDSRCNMDWTPEELPTLFAVTPGLWIVNQHWVDTPQKDVDCDGGPTVRILVPYYATAPEILSEPLGVIVETAISSCLSARHREGVKARDARRKVARLRVVKAAPGSAAAKTGLVWSVVDRSGKVISLHRQRHEARQYAYETGGNTWPPPSPLVECDNS